MRGLHAAAAEVGESRDNASAEVRGPQTIHMHASQQRMLRRGQPARECGATAGSFVAGLWRELESGRVGASIETGIGF